MAIFERQQELNTQLQPKMFKGVTGWKKGAMSAVGYNSDGTRNAWGKFNPALALNPLSHVAGEALSKDTDASGVIESQRGQMISNTLNNVKTAASLVPAGKLFGAGTKAAGLFSKAQKVNDAVSTTQAFEKTGSALVDGVQGNSAAMESASAALDESVAKSDAVEKFGVDDVDNYSTEADFMGAAGGVNDIAQKKGFLQGGKMAGLSKGLGVANQGLAIAGDIASVVQGQDQYNKGLKKKRNSLMTRKENNNNISNLY